ncbi:MAG TPA: aldo/keto reductase [Candidatus Eremiobacteraceae bacterium]|nr:aldo/keto reductase [Candidatus Eremiobacteraceae bacterium]
MKLRKLGRSGPSVSALGLGCMGMSALYGPADEKESLATIHAALEAGISLLDTGDFYGMGHNETLVRQAIQGRRDQAFVCVKFGAQRSPDGQFVGVDTRPASVKNFLAYSLQRLGTDYIDLYQPARVDRSVPIEDTVGAIADMEKAGYVRCIGLSEASVETLRRANSIHPIAALQIEYSIITRDIESDVMPALRKLGVGVTAYSVLSRGLLAGKTSSFARGDFRAHLPRFAAENLQANLKIIEALKQISAERRITVSQLCIAWAINRGEDIIPLIGARTRAQLQEALGAVDISLTGSELERIEKAVPVNAVAGTRYGAEQMAMLNG